MRLSAFTAACAVGLLSVSTPVLVARAAAADPVLTLSAARVTVDGTSNLHDWTASTTAVLVTAVEIAGADGDVLQAALQPGAIRTLDVTIPAKGLTSPKEGIDKNMHKPLKVQDHPQIRFRLRSLSLIPHWNVSASVVERFGNAVISMERHAALARALRDAGWTVVDHAAAGDLQAAA